MNLREDLVSGVTSSEGELFSCDPELKCYYLGRGYFRLDDSGAIWRRVDNSRIQDRFLVPRELQVQFMRLCHDIGQQGVTRSKERIRHTFCWWGISADINGWSISHLGQILGSISRRSPFISKS